MPYQIPAVISLGGYFELRSIPTKSSRSPFEYSGRYDVCVRVVILPSVCSILVSFRLVRRRRRYCRSLSSARFHQSIG